MLFNRKKLIFFIIVMISMLLTGALWLVLSSFTFLAETVAEKVKVALEESGYEMNLSSTSGNPITGVVGQGVNITHKGTTIASADRVVLSLSIPTLLSSSPKLSRLSLYGAKLDYDLLMKHLPEKRSGDSKPPALDTFALCDSSLSTPWGNVGADRLTVEIMGDGYGVTLKGSFRELPLLVMAKTKDSAGLTRLDDFFCKWDGMSLGASGALLPVASLDCTAEDIDIKKLTKVLPIIEKSTIKGVYKGRLAVTYDKSLSVKGVISSEKGSVWKLPFKKLRAKIKYSGKDVLLDDFSADLFDAPTSGRAFVRIKSDDYPELSLKIKTESADTRVLASEFGWLKEFPGVISQASCDLKGPAHKLSGAVLLDSPKIKISDFNCSQLKAEIGIKSMDLLSLKFATRALDASVLGSGDIKLMPYLSMNIGLDVSELSLSSIAKEYPELAKAKPEGVGSARVRLQGPASSLVISGAADFPSLVLSDDYRLAGSHSEFVYASGDLTIKELRSAWNGALVTASGSAKKTPLSKDRLLDFAGSIDKLELSSFGSKIKAIEENRLKGIISGRWVIGGSSSAPLAEFSLAMPLLSSKLGISPSDLRLAGRYQGGSLDISALSMKVDGTKINGSGALSLPLDGPGGKYLFKGSFSDLKLSRLKESGVISADISGDLGGDLRLWKDPGASPLFRAFLKDSNVVYGKFSLSGIRGALTLNNDRVELGNISALLNRNSTIRITGSVGGVTGAVSADQRTKKMPLALSFSVLNADMGRLIRLFAPDVRGFQGQLSCSADIKGTAANPELSAEGSVRSAQIQGFSFPSVIFTNVSGNNKSFSFPEIKALVGSNGVVDASAGFEKSGDAWLGRVKANGKNLDLDSLTFSLDDETRKSVDGLINFDFSGKGSLNGFDGRGEVRMPYLSVMNLKFTNVKAPFHVSDGFALVEEATAAAYGGRVVGQVAKDLRLSSWGGRLIITSADCEPIFKDLMPGSEGRIKGKLKMKISLEGSSRRVSTNVGSGNAEITGGEVTGFAGAAAVSKLMGGRPLRFASALASFSIDGRTLYLLPGSRISAQRGDPAFKYVMIDGSVAADKEIDLKCVGNVNIRALNAFAGGLSGLLNAAIDGQEAMLSNFLGGALSGFSKDEFRDVSLAIVGKPDNISFKNVHVAPPAKSSPIPEKLMDDREKEDINKDRIKINLEFPVGPGGGDISGDSGVKKQLGGQVIQQTIRGLVRF